MAIQSDDGVKLARRRKGVKAGPGKDQPDPLTWGREEGREMGRIVDLCGEIAAAAEEGPDGLTLLPDDWERLSQDWSDEDIQDALDLVRESLLQTELVEAADNLSARLVEVLGAYGAEDAFAGAERGDARLTLELMDQLSRRVERLEEILEVFRSTQAPDRQGFDALRRRLLDQGIEHEMEDGRLERLPEEAEDEEEER